MLFCRVHPCLSFISINMRKEFLEILATFTCGITLGVTLSNVTQRYINEHVEQTCPKKLHHAILTINSPMIGNQKYCIDSLKLDY